MIGECQARQHQNADDRHDPDWPKPRADPVRPTPDEDAADRTEQLRHRDEAARQRN
jgi:hypothetical protein